MFCWVKAYYPSLFFHRTASICRSSTQLALNQNRVGGVVSKMGFTDMLRRSTLADYHRKIKSAPREVILSRPLLLSAMMYAAAAIPLSELIPMPCSP